ncbi:hypothetical protein BU17DRAFT_64610 [Hysterangium stoloniferum]|nr:hypothetical protein BU17DRAFT_64610 [Hysterangium stoloniferum]
MEIKDTVHSNVMDLWVSNEIEFDEGQEFPYPMSQGRVIYPEGIPAYLNMQCIKFECFCALLSPVLLFVEVKTIAGRTCTFCSDCGLNVIIDENCLTGVFYSISPYSTSRSSS